MFGDLTPLIQFLLRTSSLRLIRSIVLAALISIIELFIVYLLSSAFSALIDDGKTKFIFAVELQLYFVPVLIIFSYALMSYFYIKFVRCSQALGRDYSNKIFNYFATLKINQLEKNNLETINKRIITDSDRVTNGIILPILVIVQKIVSIILIVAYIIPNMSFYASFTLLVIGSLYLIYFIFIKSVLRSLGKNLNSLIEGRYHIINKYFLNWREFELLKRQDLKEEFSNNNDSLAYTNSSILFWSQSPRFFLEAFIYSTIALSAIYLNPYTIDLGMLGLLVFAIMRILPSTQQIFANYSFIKSHMNALYLDALESGAQEIDPKLKEPQRNHVLSHVHFENSILDFASEPHLAKISFNYDKPKIIKIGGPSGVGKSTVLDIISSLRAFEGSRIVFKNTDLETVRCPNISFYSSSNKYNSGNIRDFLCLYQDLNLRIFLDYVDEFDLFPDVQVDANFFERQVASLSQGQFQRLSVIRMCMQNAGLYILDEPFSALNRSAQEKMERFIRNVLEGYFVFIVSHNELLNDLIDEEVTINE